MRLSSATAGIVVSVLIALAVRPHLRPADMVSAAGAVMVALAGVVLERTDAR